MTSNDLSDLSGRMKDDQDRLQEVEGTGADTSRGIDGTSIHNVETRTEQDVGVFVDGSHPNAADLIPSKKRKKRKSRRPASKRGMVSISGIATLGSRLTLFRQHLLEWRNSLRTLR